MRRWSCKLVGANVRMAEALVELDYTMVHLERKQLRESSLVDKNPRAALKGIFVSIVRNVKAISRPQKR